MLNVFLIVHNFSGAKTYADELSGYLVRKKDVYVFQIYLHYTDSKEFSIQKNNQVTSVYIQEKINKEYEKKIPSGKKKYWVMDAGEKKAIRGLKAAMHR